MRPLLLLLAACQPSPDGPVGRLVAEAAVIDMGALSVGEESVLALPLEAQDGPVRLRSAHIDDPTLSLDEALPATLAAGDALVLHFTWAPTAAALTQATLRVETDGAPLSLLLRGVAAAPTLRAWPARLDFGPSEPGEERSLPLTVENAGPAALTFTVSFSDPAFSLAAAQPLTLRAGARAALGVAYTAPDDAPRAATLDLPGLRIGLQANDCAAGGGDAYDVDGDGFSACFLDCDDRQPTVHPGAAEAADDLDNDCDGQTDEGTIAADDDGDGLSEEEGDCDDGEPATHPGAAELPDNGRDDDCDGLVDAGSPDGDGDGFSPVGGDCDDAAPTVHPHAAEAPDGLDNDCDGATDEGTTAADDDGDGLSEEAGDCDDTESATLPGAAEAPDGADNDCDGAVDEGTTQADDDGDGFTEAGGDCDDSDASVHPGAAERAGDGLDADCDGVNP